MKSQSPFVRSDRRIKFYSESPVYLHISVVIEPWHPKYDGAFRFYHPFQNSVLAVFGVDLNEGNNGFRYFLNRLQKFWFMTVFGSNASHKRFHGGVMMGD